MRRRWPLLLVGLLTLAGLLLRLHQYGQSLVGDEYSTLWVVDGRGPGDVVDLVSGDGEITPPLYFLLAWAASKLGSAPELIRLPSLIAGVATIPLAYLLGRELRSREVGIVAAAVVTLTPYLTYFSGNARAYSVMVACLAGSALAMLWAVRGRGAGWWAAYAAFACLAMYSHYTAVFPLAAQFAWLVWAHPERRRQALLASGAAALAFAPWIGGLLADLDSPTTKVLEAIQGDGFGVKRMALEQTLYGHPLAPLGDVPGLAARLVILAALAAAVCATAVRLARSRERDRGLVLVLALALAAPAAELAMLALGTDIFGARNLASAWPGAALACAVAVVEGGRRLAVALTVLLVAGFSLAAASMFSSRAETIDFESGSRFVAERIAPGGVLVDSISAGVTPVPLTPFDVYGPAGARKFNLSLPQGEPPFLPLTPVPPPQRLVRRAFREAAGGELVYVDPGGAAIAASDGRRARFGYGRLDLPAGARVVEQRVFPGYRDLRVSVISVPGSGSGG